MLRGAPLIYVNVGVRDRWHIENPFNLQLSEQTAARFLRAAAPLPGGTLRAAAFFSSCIGNATGASDAPIDSFVLLFLVAVALALTLAALLLAGRIVQALGRTGTNVINRLLGTVPAALAAQYVLDGSRAAMAY